ncbi:MAG: YHS domain protein [Opitutae bacterium]|nr:YHS domain protein [Opitutae bacterium]
MHLPVKMFPWAIFSTLLLSLVTPGKAATLNVDDHGVFLGGYDVVAYFTAHEATVGDLRFSTRHEGAIFHFATQGHLDAFKAAPARYLPKFGGFCAFAVANGKTTVKANPRTFKLRDGALYLFFDDLYEGKRFNTIVPWNENEREFLSRAEANWAPAQR